MVQLIWWLQQLILSYYDIKLRQVPLILLIMNGVIAIINSVMTSNFYIKEAIFISGVLLVFYWLMQIWLKKEAIGLGDIVLLITFALYQGALNTYMAMTIGSILSLMWVLFQPNTKLIPFVPFLEIGLGVSILWPFH